MKPSLLLLSLLFATSAFAEVKTETITIPMRDGVTLTADLYRDDSVKEAPVILTRTPYDRTKQKGTGEKWAKAGYIFIAQDCRGKFGSSGDFAPYNNEGQDGYDTIEWITRQSWCSGRVGMMGGSYVGARTRRHRPAGHVEQFLSQSLPRRLRASLAYRGLDRGQLAQAGGCQAERF
jgi:dienelactone hydrolase